MALAQILFDDEELFILRYVFAHEPDFEKHRELTRAIVEIAMLEGSIIELLSDTIRREQGNQGE